MIEAEADIEPAQILIVEDDEVTAKVIEHRLRRLGYRIAASVRSGVEALEKAVETHPDIVLMDIRLEGTMDGVETARRMREYLGVPVAYLTGCLDDATVERAKTTVAFGYALKPFQEREVHTMIQMALARHRLEMELEESRRWLSTILGAIGEGVIATGPDGRVRFLNPEAERLTGLRPADALGKELAEVFHVERSDTDPSRPDSLGARRVQQAVLLGRNGTRTPVEFTSAPAWDERAKIAGFVWTFRDVTERRRAEESLRRDEQHYRSLIETASDVIVVIDPEGMVYYVSPAIERLLGYQPADVVGKRAALFVHEEDRRKLFRFARAVRRGGRPEPVAVRARHADASWRVVEMTGNRLPDGSGGLVGTVREIAAGNRRGVAV